MTDLIFQWNVRGLGPAKEDVIKIIDEHNPMVLAFQETFYGNDFIPNFKNYNGLCKQGHFNQRYQGGVALYIHSSCPYSPLQLNSTLQVIAARVRLGNKTITVASIYIPPRSQITSGDLQNLINQLPRPYLLIGDYNAHHPSWDHHRCDTRGRMVDSFLRENGLVCLNSNIPTHTSGSSIDLSICSPELGADLEWNILPSPFSSDHFPILLKLTYAPLEDDQLNCRYNYKKANWNKYFTDEVFYNIPEDISSIPPNDTFDDIMRRIMTAADNSIPIYVSGKIFPSTLLE